MKKHKGLGKLLAMTLVLSLVLSLLGGCSGTGGQGTSTPSSDASQEGASGSETGSGTDESAEEASKGDTQAGTMKTIKAVLVDLSYQGTEEEFINDYDSAKYEKWNNAVREARLASGEVAPTTVSFYQNLLKEALTAENGENNLVLSPVNLYMALCMLAEVTGGTTRDEIVSALGAADIDEVRKNADLIYQANYLDTPVSKELISNSLWLNNKFSYYQDTLDTLASVYHAQSTYGTMGSEEMDNALRDWLNDATGNLMEDSVNSISTDADTLAAIISAIYLKIAWSSEFNEAATDEGTFHGAAGDTQVDMMHKQDDGAYFYYDNFSAATLYLKEDIRAYFILPDEGVSIAEVAASSDFAAFIEDPYQDGHSTTHEITYTIPKFRVESKMDLNSLLGSLGISSVFSDDADFSSLSGYDTVLTSAQHAAVLELDEEGIEAAAYTVFMMNTTAMPPDDEPIEFVVDRPFILMLRGADDSILFTAAVYNIEVQ